MSLQRADRQITEVIGYFAEFGIDLGLLVPTETGLAKSIMDAHGSLRDYLKLKGLHDYDTQLQGQDDKKMLPAWLVTQSGTERVNASLYRPPTKKGDPRIWISGLPAYARPGNVLALVAGDGGLYVINASDEALLASGRSTATPFAALLARLAPKASAAAAELLDKLKLIAARGFIQTMRPGPTGVGFTLETLLGIRANSRRAPDYKGIEIKAGRTAASGRATVRTTLFSKTPDWEISPYGRVELLRAYGRPDDTGRIQIYCELNNKPNPTFGFYLNVDGAADALASLRGDPLGEPKATDESIFKWPMPALRSALLAKHPETFWVKAQARSSKTTEEFHYFEVSHTPGPLPGNFAPLIETGHVELDFVMHLAKNKKGGDKCRDHGFLFKMWAKDRPLLFAAAKTYSLV
jgi:hypothetical protein